MKLLDTNNMSKREKDKLKKKQEQLDHCLDVLQIDDDEFYSILRDEPARVRSFLDQTLMKRITNLTCGGGDTLAEELEKVEISKVGKRGSISETTSIGKRGSISDSNSGSKRGSISEDRLQQRRRTSSSGSSPPLSRNGSKKSTRNGVKKGVPQPVIRDKHTLHEAYYKMIEAYATEIIVESQ